MKRWLCVVAVGWTAFAAPAAGQRPTKGEDESAALIEEGRAALKVNKLDDAAKALDQAIALNPRRVDAYVLRSAVHAARKEYRKGVEVMRRAQELAPADDEVLAALGAQLVLAGDGDAGSAMLVGVTTRNPARYESQLVLARHLRSTAHWPEAIAAYELYLKHRPAALASDDWRHRIDLADAYLRGRKPARALELFRSAASERKDDTRARIGVAWATAAIDCKQARPLLAQLEPLADNYPEIWLVDGQCALALGDAAGALALGRKYVLRSTASTAAGHALVGEAHAARGNLDAARTALETARRLEPARRRWPVRLASILRRAGSTANALATLDDIGPPEAPRRDPEWWVEYGECLLAKGDPTAVVTKVGPVVTDLPNEPTVRLVVGAAHLQAGQVDVALKLLGEADAIESTPRSRKLLVDGLTTAAYGKLTADDAASAEPLLVRADELDGNPTVWRNLGAARLALGKPADAIAPLDRALKADPAAATLILAARARADSGQLAAARPLYERAVADRELGAEAAIDWAAAEVAGNGELAGAIAALEKVTPKSGPLVQRHRAALAKARHAAGVAALKAGAGPRAIELLKAAAAVDSSLAVKCDLALAAVVAGDAVAALAALRAVQSEKCPFPAPADSQAVPILIAFTEGVSLRRAAKALDKLTSLAGRATGPAAALLNTSIRVVALEATRDAYAAGQTAQVRRFLTSARSATARVGGDEVAHNAAVLDLMEGRIDAAIGQLERLAGKLPEALINLGVAYERKGEPLKALDYWRRARRAGARFAPLADWIEAKERIYGAKGDS